MSLIKVLHVIVLTVGFGLGRKCGFIIVRWEQGDLQYLESVVRSRSHSS